MRTILSQAFGLPLVMTLAGLSACGTGPDDRIESASAAASEQLTYPDLLRLIQGHGTTPALRSLDAFLDRLASDYPGSLSNFALVYASRSLQSASPDFPRVIAFGSGYDLNTGTNTRLVLAFPGDPSKPDFNTLEVMSLDEHESIHLSEVRFPSSGSGAPVVEENPARCATCHGSPSRPIWDSYPVWPGAYGQNEDEVVDHYGELTNFRAVAAKFGHDGRYRRLNLNAKTSDGKMYFGADPNRELQVTLNNFAMRQIVARLANEPRFATLKYAMLGAGAGCLDHGSDGWFSPTASAGVGLTEAQVERVTKRDLDDNRAAKARRFFNLGGEAVPPGSDDYLRSIDAEEPVTGTRFVSLLMGEDMRSWSMTLAPHAFSFATRGMDNLVYALAQRLKNDPVVSAAIPEPTPIESNVDCDKLKAATKAAMTDAAAQEIGAGASAMQADLTSDGMDSQAPILRCMSCHTAARIGPDGTPLPPASGAAPYYPFDQPKALGKLLAEHDGELAGRMIEAINAAPDAPGRMPKAPRRPLTSAEQTALTDFIRGLAADASAGAH